MGRSFSERLSAVAKLHLSFIPAAEAATHEQRHQHPAGID